MSISVVFVNWNGRDLLEPALESLENISDIWVVDNGSNDGSVDYLRQSHPEVNLIANETNRGFGSANNQALKQINTEYALLLNTDARLEKGSLEKAMGWMNDHARTAIVGARLIHENGREQNSVSTEITLSTEILNRKIITLLRGDKSKGLNQPTPVSSVIGAAMLVRLEALREVNFFDEDYFFFFEETDLCYRLNQKGWGIVHHPDFRVRHLQGQSAGKRPLPSRIEFHLSRECYFFKHFGREAACTLHTWMERRLRFTFLLNTLGCLLSLGLWKSRRHDLTRQLVDWYRRGCPENEGLRPPVISKDRMAL